MELGIPVLDIYSFDETFVMQRGLHIWEGARGGAQPGQGDQPEVHREEGWDRLECADTVGQDDER